MDRIDFLKLTGTFTTSLLVLPSSKIFALSKNKKMERIGLTTVVFRNRFRSTAKVEPDIEFELTDIPAFYRQRFGIQNLEFWSPHFNEINDNYLKDLRKAIKKERCKLINIQVDTPGLDVSSQNEENRIKAVDSMKKWIDAGSKLGSEMIRVSAMKGQLNYAVSSVKQLNEYAKSKGVKLLVENHNDMFSNPDIHLQFANEMVEKNVGLIADFGNYPNTVNRFEALKRLTPYTKLVSAKVKDFDETYRHLSYDFCECVRVMEKSGYQGIYSIEQWDSAKSTVYDYEKIVEKVIDDILVNL